ncbi:MAG: hypothetical protein HKO64_12565 [Xanthomonadales bacterium]|nr:hypothetical protein [Gammaproteobacteria bacterium]NNE06217.1 hypothetical protein [Xanthomonadales bacterium]NNL96446.1 hypothetical protein [Xanthomonadales bacterium]
MSKKSGKMKLKKLRGMVQESGFDDEFDFDFEDELEIASLAGYDDEWDEEDDVQGRFSPRRKIERRRDMKKVYSDLDDWDQFGSEPGM